MERIGIKELCPKITKRIKGRFKKKCKYNWPELDNYCGCCSLSTGIYIRSAINLVMTAITILWNAKILSHVLDISPSVFSTNLTANENLSVIGLWVPKHDLTRLYIIFNCIATYYILWLCYKVIYVLILIWTIFAIFKRNVKMMKILLYISIPNLILDIFISFLAAIIIRFTMRILLIIGILIEGYNILALNSEYKKLIGKSKVRHKDIESGPGTQSLPPLINLPHGDLRYGYNQVHCRGCNCIINEPPEDGNGDVSIQSSADPVQTTLITNKEIDENELNYAITGILSPRHTDESVRNETVRSTSVQQPVRPTSLDLILNKAKDEKVVITDEPVIYDVNQLNVGTSPVVEDREEVYRGRENCT